MFTLSESSLEHSAPDILHQYVLNGNRGEAVGPGRAKAVPDLFQPSPRPASFDKLRGTGSSPLPDPE